MDLLISCSLFFRTAATDCFIKEFNENLSKSIKYSKDDFSIDLNENIKTYEKCNSFQQHCFRCYRILKYEEYNKKIYEKYISIFNIKDAKYIMIKCQTCNEENKYCDEYEYDYILDLNQESLIYNKFIYFEISLLFIFILFYILFLLFSFSFIH